MLPYSALAADVVCVIAFAVVGRSSHGEANDLLGVLKTAWPFLVGTLAGVLTSRFWRHPTGLRTGVVVWVGTVVGGVLLRLASGQGAPLAFVIVATVALGLLILGWRGLHGLVQSAQARREHRLSL